MDGWKETPFMNYHSKFNEVTRVFLNEQELEKLFNCLKLGSTFSDYPKNSEILIHFELKKY